ncbi:exodeoxyribonuclease VII small subunit [Virgibacillus sp. DJP39]|uniref:exodeoxyribonuclease VII small subunit n=1 Tax=Virgibacillus sp. DJP39 TaxID=3409790 RepID=UPI003BB8088A
MSEEKKELSFEEAMEDLEKIVEQLEEGDVPLEKAITFYQDGMKLSKLCNDKLVNVQEKMTKIMNEQGELKPFDLQEEE